MRAIFLPAVALALASGMLAAPEAQARFNGLQIETPSLVEDVACVTRQVRTVRPNGRVVYRTVRECGVGPRFGGRDGCRVVRERIERPNGTTVMRTTRRCR